jgi:hypothetical protein
MGERGDGLFHKGRFGDAFRHRQDSSAILVNAVLRVERRFVWA